MFTTLTSKTSPSLLAARVRSFGRIRLPLWTLTLGLALALSACSSRTTQQGGDQGGIHLDAGSDALPTRDYTFVPDDDGKQSPAVALKLLGGPKSGELELAVVARGVAKLQGVAFRLQLPSGVELISTAGGPDFAAPTGVAKLKQVDRELWAGVGRRGRVGVDAASVERTIATLKLRVQATGALPLTFRPHHNLVLESENGKSVEVSWLGGTLKPR
jgi:hypothetical protein